MNTSIKKVGTALGLGVFVVAGTGSSLSMLGNSIEPQSSSQSPSLCYLSQNGKKAEPAAPSIKVSKLVAPAVCNI